MWSKIGNTNKKNHWEALLNIRTCQTKLIHTHVNCAPIKPWKHLSQVSLMKRIFSCSYIYTWDWTNCMKHLPPKKLKTKVNLSVTLVLDKPVSRMNTTENKMCVAGLSLNSGAESSKARRNQNRAEHRTLAKTVFLCSKWLILPQSPCTDQLLWLRSSVRQP